MKFIKKTIWICIYFILGHLYPKGLSGIHFRRAFGRSIDWKNPHDINEKIQWLKFYTDTSSWTPLADKYAVRDYLKEKGLEDMLVSFYGKWDDANAIEWDSLPNQFVMKTNHGSGDVIICKDKKSLNRKQCTAYFNRLLKRKTGTIFGEPHYDKILPCVIAEELLDCTKQSFPSTSLIDYKIWSFDGKPEYVWVCYDRTKESCTVLTFDKNWIPHPEYSVSKPHYVLSDKTLPRPASLDKMLEAAAILSKGFPVVRVDFYEVDGKAYFGELTFTSSGGFNDFYTQEFLNILGDKCELPIKR